MAEQSVQNLTSFEGKIFKIPKPYVGIINFILKNQRVQAFFFTQNFYHNGERISRKTTSLTKFLKIGDNIYFTAVPNLRENSFNIRWKAVTVWKGSQKPKILNVACNTVEHRQGHVIYVDDKDGLIKCSKTEEKCIFSYLNLFINNKQLPAGLSLKAFANEGDFVQYQAEHRAGIIVGQVYKWEAVRVWKEDFESFDHGSSCRTFDELHESDNKLISVESKKSKKAAMPTIVPPSPVVINNLASVPRPGSVFLQEMRSEELGVVTAVDSQRAVVTFAYGNLKERVLIVRNNYEDGVPNQTLKEFLALGDKVIFDCHLYDKPDRSDKCKWFGTKCTKDTAAAVVSVVKEVKPNSVNLVLSNQAATVTDVCPNMGEVLLLSGEHEGQRITFRSKVFISNGKPLIYGMNLKDYVKPNDHVQIDAKWCDEDGDGMWFSWTATAVWKGEKFASYRAAVETNKSGEYNENVSIVDMDKLDESKFSCLDVVTSYSDLFTHSQPSLAISENSAVSSNFTCSPNPPKSETLWDTEPDEVEMVQAPVWFSEEKNNKASQLLEAQFKDLIKAPPAQEKKESTEKGRSSAAPVLGHTQTTANPILSSTNEPKPDTSSASVSLMVDLMKQLEDVSLSSQKVLLVMYGILDNLRLNIRLSNDQEDFLTVVDQLKPFLDLNSKNGEGSIEKDFLKNPNGLLKTLYELFEPSSSPGNLNAASFLSTINNAVTVVPLPGALSQRPVMPLSTPLPYKVSSRNQNSNMAQANTTQSPLQYANNFNIASSTGQQQFTIGAQQSNVNNINFAALGGQQTNADFNFAALGGQTPSNGQLNLASLGNQAHDPHIGVPSLNPHHGNLNLAAVDGQLPMAYDCNLANFSAATQQIPNGSDASIIPVLENVIELHSANPRSISASGTQIPFLSGGHQHLGVSPAPQHGGTPQEHLSSQVCVGTGEMGECLKEDEGYLLWKSATTRTVEKVHFTRNVCFLMNIQLDKMDIRSLIKPGMKVDFKARKTTNPNSPYNWEAIQVKLNNWM